MKSNVSHEEFGARTTATEAARAFAGEIRGKVGEYFGLFVCLCWEGRYSSGKGCVEFEMLECVVKPGGEWSKLLPGIDLCISVVEIYSKSSMI